MKFGPALKLISNTAQPLNKNNKSATTIVRQFTIIKRYFLPPNMSVLICLFYLLMAMQVLLQKILHTFIRESVLGALSQDLKLLR